MSPEKEADAARTARLQAWGQPLLMLASLLLAYILPFEGLFLSYAILGPLHYLTQISWLYDRRCFMPDNLRRRFFVGAVVALAAWIGLSGAPFQHALPRLDLYGCAFIALSLFILPLALRPAVHPAMQALLVALVPVIVWALLHLNAVYLLGAFLLTTVFHTGVFTFSFLLLGARRTRELPDIVSAGAWVLCVLFVFVIPPEVSFRFGPGLFDGQRALFDPAAEILGARQPGLDHSWASAYGLLTFIFTYHYLNWFSKTELLKWHQVPLPRGIAIAALYLSAIGLYFYDYGIGFRALLFLSLLHVFLEFPLNLQTLRALMALRGEVKGG
ncbi:MAG: hypothetical protein EPN97_14130 [Alphaproteobacteria bacterium]|nr:MAG: hypothetical protein EPN97_14130 [Alphaproteobacteria bacterium]